MIVDHTNRRVLDVLESREKAVVEKYLRESQESGLLAQVVEVTGDMWDGYVEAAREVFGPSVTLTIDRFHVMKNWQDRLTAARREIQHDLPASEARELRGSRWLWLTNPENLAEEQRQRLTELKSQFPRVGTDGPEQVLRHTRTLAGQNRQLFRLPLQFVSRSSNGLRTILRRTFGMLNFHNFRLRVLDRFGKPQPQEST